MSLIESIYLDSGDEESGNEENINNEFLALTKAIYDILKEKLTSTEFAIINDAEHNYSFFRERVPEFFSFLTNNFDQGKVSL
ncbi:hypothetical protein P4U90_16325 [Cytobacillus kochii]|uniref:hypothetical protein n=1 Tax=Cytobacillus kochii TaxID=859143 RepID=UPI002E1B4C83|nr:hypothetical protein [Cytobacillus kochii]